MDSSPANPNPKILPAYHQQTSTSHQHPDINSTLSILPAYHQQTSTSHQHPDINSTLSTLKHLIYLSKTTINRLSATATATTTATCPYDSKHRVPPTSLFRHYLHCRSSPAPIDYLQSPHSNFFYRDCPAVVTFPQHNYNNNDHLMLTLPAVLSAECADSSIDHDGLFTTTASYLLPSECYNVRIEISNWNDYPSFYSLGVLRSIVCCCCYMYDEKDLMEWMLVNSPFYGVVIDVVMRDHILLLFRVCLKAIVREATGHMRSISKGAEPARFDCPVLVSVLMWLASQLGVLYGETNGKLFAINMLKQSLLNVSSTSLNDIFGNGSKEVDGTSRKGMVLVSQVAAAVAALHERFAFEARIKAIRLSRFVPVYQRVQEHDYISKKADEERKKRPNYRRIIEHDGVLWHRGGNQDSNKNKSQEELLAEERDYKRRRMSYRGKKIKRSTTQVMRDIIDEYMEEIKHANMAGQPSADARNLESDPSSISNMHTDKHRHDEIKRKTLWKESVSDASMRSVQYEDEAKEKSNKHRHMEDNRSRTRTKGRS